MFLVYPILEYSGVIPLATSTPGTISWVSFDVPLNEYRLSGSFGSLTTKRLTQCDSCNNNNCSNKTNLYIFWKTHISGMFWMLTICSSIVFSCSTLSVTLCTKSGGYESIPWVPGHMISLLRVISRASFWTVKMTANLSNFATINYTLYFTAEHTNKNIKTAYGIMSYLWGQKFTAMSTF